MSADLIIPGKTDKERRVFHHTLSGQSLTGTDTAIDMFMDSMPIGAPPAIFSPNPGFTHCVRLTHVFVDFIHGGAPPAGNWTMSIYKNESLVAAATFVFTATGGVATHQKTCGPLDPCIEFDPCDTYYVNAAGPVVNVALFRSILRFEEIGGP